MPTIPNGIEPITSGYSISGPGGAMRTEVGGGMPRYGLDWDGGAIQVNVTLMLVGVQVAVWTVFYLRVIGQGTISFDMPLDSGLGKSMHSVNIVPGTYNQSDYNGDTVMVSFVVETESQAYSMSEADAQNLVDLYNALGPSMLSLFDRLDLFANHDTNVLDF